MIAASAGHEQVISLLLAKGAQVNAVNNTGQCSLHYAASKDRYQVHIPHEGWIKEEIQFIHDLSNRSI